MPVFPEIVTFVRLAGVGDNWASPPPYVALKFPAARPPLMVLSEMFSTGLALKTEPLTIPPPNPRRLLLVFVEATAWLPLRVAWLLIVSVPELKIPPPFPPAAVDPPLALLPFTVVPSNVAVEFSAA